MFVERLNGVSPPDVVSRRPVGAVSGDDGKAAFALVYEALLALSDEDCSETSTSDNWLDTAAQEGSLGWNGSSSIGYSFNKVSGPGGLQHDLRDTKVQDSVSAMVQLNFQGGSPPTQLSPMPGGDVPPRTMDARAWRNQGLAQLTAPSDNVPPPLVPAGVLNKNLLSDWMDAHALARSSHHCARYVRMGMEAAGVDTGDRPSSGDAGDYGPFLLRHGAQTVPPESYGPQVGDVVVFDKTVQHPNGHIEMYDGRRWVSDFMQNSFSPYRNATSTPSFTIYRIG